MISYQLGNYMRLNKASVMRYFSSWSESGVDYWLSFLVSHDINELFDPSHENKVSAQMEIDPVTFLVRLPLQGNNRVHQ